MFDGETIIKATKIAEYEKRQDLIVELNQRSNVLFLEGFRIEEQFSDPRFLPEIISLKSKVSDIFASQFDRIDHFIKGVRNG